MQNTEKDTSENQISKSSRSKLLMVDDSKVIRKSASKMLGDKFDIVVAEDGLQGWELVQQDHEIQVIFTDLDMPVMNGYELLEKIRSHSDEGVRNMPVIVITGADNDEQAKEKAYELGATDFITKPFNSTDVKARAAAHADYQRFKRISNIDEQTGLPNRHGFELQLEKDISFTGRHHQDFAVMMLEINDFKDLFLKVGRGGAETIVNQVAKVLIDAVRKEDTVGRIGISRFVISLPTAKTEAVKALAERISENVAKFKARLKGEKLLISLSSAAYVPDFSQDVTIENLFENMDRVLLKAQSDSVPLVVELARQEESFEQQAVSLDDLSDSIEAGVEESYLQQLELAMPLLRKIVDVMSEEQRNRLIEVAGD